MDSRTNEERQYAMTWIKERLSVSDRRASDIREEAEVQGISYGTLRRAFRDIGGKAVHKGRVPVFHWYWSLPGRAAQNPSGELCASTDDPDEFADYFKPFMLPKTPA